MKELESKYNCSEFFEEYHSKGMFHPTEAQMLYSHSNVYEENNCLIIGGVYDDHDFKICYRNDNIEIWAKSNYDNSFQKLSKDLKQLTEGWYQIESNHWGSMTSDMNLKEIIKFYELNDERYQWDSKLLIKLIRKLLDIESGFQIFTKAHKANLNISTTNGFNGRPRTKMVTVQLDSKKKKMKIFHQKNFFDHYVQAQIFVESEMPQCVTSIINWIK